MQPADQERSQALARTVAVVNDKGGVLKTSLVANVGGALAAGGMKVLLVDLDASGNLKLDLGLTGGAADGDDAGKGLVDAVWFGSALPVVTGVRPNLDFVFGGRGLTLLSTLARENGADFLPGGSVASSFVATLARAAGDYDLVLLDCPPHNGEMQDMALAAARWVLIPTHTDQASFDGLLGLGPRVARARREHNAGLDYLGVVLTSHNPSATRIARAARKSLDVIGDKVPMMATAIRHSQSAAHDCRERGQLAHELAADASSAQSQRLVALSAARLRKVTRAEPTAMPQALSGTANSLAGDYRSLASEICQRITAAEAGQSGAHAPTAGATR